MIFRYITLPIILIGLWLNVNGQNGKVSIFDPLKMHRVDITFKQDDWTNRLMKYKSEGSNHRLSATVKIDNQIREQVQVRYKGHSSYNNFVKADISKLPFNLKIKKKSSTKPFEDDIRTIKLSNIFRDRSYVREYLSYQIIGHYLPLPKIAFTEVFVNNEFLGLYEIIEAVDDPFLKRTFKDSDGTFIKGDPIWRDAQIAGCPASENASLQYLGKHPDCYKKWYELKSKKGWNDLIQLTSQLRLNPQKIESHLDVHSTLWMIALNNVLVSLDSYSGALCHNYYLYKPSDGPFVPIMWDFNLSFGAFRSTGVGKKLNVETMQRLSPYSHFKEKNQKRPLINSLLGQPMYRKLYINMIKTIVQDFFQDEQYLAMAKSSQQFISASVQKELGQIYSYADFKDNVVKSVRTKKDSLVGIQELMAARTDYLQTHPSIQHTPPKANKSSLKLNPENGHLSVEIQNAERVMLYYKLENQYSFKSIGLTSLDNLVWETNAIPTNMSSYYFVFENKKAAALLPERAPWFPFSMSENNPNE